MYVCLFVLLDIFKEERLSVRCYVSLFLHLFFSFTAFGLARESTIEDLPHNHSSLFYKPCLYVCFFDSTPTVSVCFFIFFFHSMHSVSLENPLWKIAPLIFSVCFMSRFFCMFVCLNWHQQKTKTVKLVCLSLCLFLHLCFSFTAFCLAREESTLEDLPLNLFWFFSKAGLYVGLFYWTSSRTSSRKNQWAFITKLVYFFTFFLLPLHSVSLKNPL